MFSLFWQSSVLALKEQVRAIGVRPKAKTVKWRKHVNEIVLVLT